MGITSEQTVSSRVYEHPTAKGADGCFYCRSLNARVDGDFLYCGVCPLFGGFVGAEDGSAGRNGDSSGTESSPLPAESVERLAVKCVYADGGKEFPDYLPEEADEGQRLCECAIQFAAVAHKGDYRKGNRLPYIVHPMEVMTLVSQMTDDAEVVAAGALHDVVEDTPYTIEDIRKAFGDRVAYLVAMESEDKRPDRPKEETWRIRKEESLAHDKDAPVEAKYIMLADKLSNMRATLRDYQKDGHGIWQKFNMKDEAQQEWYYRQVARVLVELKDEPLYREYEGIIKTIFG